MHRITCLNRKLHGVELRRLKFHGGFFLTSPLDDFARRAIHRNLDETTTPDPPTSLTQNVMPDYGATNVTSSLQGSAAELQQLPHADSSHHRRSSDSSWSSSSNTSSQQGTTAISSSLPLLERPGQTKVISRRNPCQRQSEDSTV